MSTSMPIASAVQTFTQQDLDDFGRASGGNGRIHTDRQYAAASPFGRTLVQGLYLLAVAEKLLCEAAPSWGRGGDLEIVFVAPVGVGDTVRVEVNQGGAPDEYRIEASAEQGTVLVGTARLLDRTADASGRR